MKAAYCLAALLYANAASAAGWLYDHEIDAMTSKRVDYAFIGSSNSLDLPWPYQGPNYGMLNVRREPSQTVVYLEINKGQIVGCVTGCPIDIRFDEKPPVRFNGRGPADYSSRVAFVLPASKFIAMAKTAKTIRVQVSIYQASSPVIVFEGSALVWPPPN